MVSTQHPFFGKKIHNLCYYLSLQRAAAASGSSGDVSFMSGSKRRATSRGRRIPWAEDVFVDASLPEVLDRVARTGLRSFDAGLCTIWLLHRGKLHLEAAAGMDPGQAPARTLPLGRSLSGQTAVSSQERLLADIDSERIPGLADCEPYLGGSILTAPILFQGECLGVINLCRPGDLPPFDGTDLSRLVASSAAIGLAVAAQRVVVAQTAELRDQDQHLRTLFEDAPNPIFVLDWRGRFQEANRAAASFLGLPVADLPGRSLRDLCSREAISDLWNGLIAGEAQSPREVIFRIHGSEKTLLLNLVPVNVGSTVTYYAIGHDITPIKEAEQELRTSEDRYRRIVAASPALLCELEPDGLTRYVNPAVEAITGYTPEEVVGRNWWRLFYPGESAACVDSLLELLLAGRDVRDYEMTMTAKDGTQRVLQWSSANQYEPDGTLSLMVGFGLDITERLEAEREKDALGRQLYLARRLESVGRLAGGIAHDFNNLLTAIMNYASLAAEEIPPHSQAYEDVMEIRKAGTRATHLVRQLLAYSRKEVVHPRVVDLNHVLRDMLKMLERLLVEHIRLDTRLQPNLPSIRIDPGQLEQIVVNLAINAAQAMPKGGTLTIETDVASMDPERVRRFLSVQEGKHVRLLIRDTGEGIPKDVLSKIFEPFFTTKGRGGGTGLGLATVYGIVKQASGAIFVDSTPGKGTEFEVAFPAVDQRPDTRPDSSLSHPMVGGQERILLVEDSEGVRDIACRILSRHGYEILQASSGDEALDLLSRLDSPPDLLLTDVIMPGMPIQQMVEEATRAYPTLRVLYMSGYPDSLVTAQGVLLDDVHFLPKPFTPKSLLGAVSQTLRATPPPHPRP